jgi:hypothetical protein
MSKHVRGHLALAYAKQIFIHCQLLNFVGIQGL